MWSEKKTTLRIMEMRNSWLRRGNLMRIRGGDCDDDVLSLTFSCYFFTTLTAIYAVEYVHVVSPHDAAHVDLGPSHWFPRADSNNVEMKVSASDLHVNCADLITPIR